MVALPAVARPAVSFSHCSSSFWISPIWSVSNSMIWMNFAIWGLLFDGRAGGYAVSSGGVERAAQVGNEVVRRLQPHREPHQRGVDRERRVGDRRVRHARRVLDEALHGAEALRQGEQPCAGHEIERGLL